MKKTLLIFATALLALSCTKEQNTTVENSNSSELTEKNREIDSLKNVIENQAPTAGNNQDSPTPADEAPTETPPAADHDLSGRHGLTLQWISWEQPGTVTFKKTGTDTYKISGKQAIKKQYVTVDGTVKRISDTQLEFDGTIVTFTDLDGKCVKEGKQTFLSTQDRKYWRLQNMQNCNGAVDYVDIYF